MGYNIILFFREVIMKKRFLTFFILILVVSFLVSFGYAEKKYDRKILKQASKLRKEGDKALKKKEFDKAIEYYLESLKLYPEDKRVHNNLAIAYVQKNEYEEAVKHYERALEIDPKFKNPKRPLLNLLNYLGGQYMKKGDFKKSNLYYEKLLKYLGNDKKNQKFILSVNYRMGINFYRLRDNKKSLEYLQKVLNYPEFQKEFPKLYPPVIYLVGVNYTLLGDKANGNKYLKEYISLKSSEENKDPFVAYAYFFIGENSFKTLEDKIEELKKSKDKKEIEKVRELASSMKEEIEPYFKKCIELNPKFEDAYTKLGNFYYLIKDLNKALEIYNKVVELFPNSPSINSYKRFRDALEKKLNSQEKK